MEALQYYMEEFDPLTTSDEIFEKYFDFRDILFREEEPDDPFTPRSLRKDFMKNPSPYYKTFYWIIFSDMEDDRGTIIANASVTFTLANSPSYDTNKHVADCGISVHPNYRRNGIATKLLQVLLNKISEYDDKISVIQTGTSLESGHQFCQKLKGIEAIKGAENRLRLVDVDWEMIKQWKKEGSLRATDVIIESFEDVPENDIQEYVEIYTETMNQQPMGEIETRAKVTPESRRENEKRLADRGLKWFTKITREPDGRISGLTEIFYHSDMAYKAFQNLTGVKEVYRGRGLGKWLKAEMLLWLKDEFPDVTYISTGNATDNVPMLSINERMGFKEHNTGSAYKFQIEDLVKQLSVD
jgi:GNAT superfamily N-acetyltransferase